MTDRHDDEVERLVRQMSLLLRQSRAVMRVVAGQVHPEVDASAYAVLLVIREAGSLRLGELAGALGLDKSTMSRQIAPLLRLGLVARRPDPGDGRAFLLELSPTGAERLDAVTRERRAAWRERLATWSTADITALTDGIARLVAAMPAEPER